MTNRRYRDMDNMDIFVIGSNHHNTLGVVRSLGFKGLRPILILVTAEKRPYVSFSRYVKQYVRADNDNQAVLKLKEFALKQKAIVIACSDGIASAIDMSFNELKNTFILPGCSSRGVLTELMNKEIMSKLAREVGLTVPETWLLKKFNRNNDKNLNPCITKPILSKDSPKSDINICWNQKELELAIKSGCSTHFQVQKYIDKQFEYQLIGLSVDGGGKIIIPGVSLCIRPCPRTNTGYLKYEPFENYDFPINKCCDFIKRTGYSGLFSMEFLRGKDNKDYFLETNFRNDGNSICVTKAGTNLPFLLYTYYAKEREIFERELASCIVKAIYVMPEFDDHQFVSMGEISLWHWLKDLYCTDALMEFDKADPIPFFVRLYDMVKMKISSYHKHK